ncbi:hypothetical protein EUBDOL_02121 [Amedibacillus dolichus DSM 3991]|uniref:Uncharacterized protein n=1 Tax=Amedibacillus dolichus DSM 3991 TaxID=428127 RepID=A8RF08_9FIRM|nr:hypothetical protein EUBDOL_02121 [Amedibacillus dolichus DSM 3991]
MISPFSTSSIAYLLAQQNLKIKRPLIFKDAKATRQFQTEKQ